MLSTIIRQSNFCKLSLFPRFDRSLIAIMSQGMLFMVFLLSGSGVAAAIVEGLHEAEVIVENTSAEQREAAFQKALADVLVKMSGSSAVVNEPAIRDVLRTSSQYVQQYRYLESSSLRQARRVEEGDDVLFGEHDTGKVLWVKFNARPIQVLLRENNLPIWGSQRPAVLVWLAVQEGRKRYLLNDASVSEIKEELEMAALRRGLPLVWPSTDLIKREGVSYGDVVGEFWEILQRASVQEGDLMVVGHAQKAADRWQVTWDMPQDYELTSWQAADADLPQLMTKSLNRITDVIARNYAVISLEGEGRYFYIRVAGVNELTDYAQVTRYLKSLGPINRVYVVDVSPDDVLVRIDARSSYEDVKRVIALGSVLKQDGQAAPDSGDEGGSKMVVPYRLIDY